MWWFSSGLGHLSGLPLTHLDLSRCKRLSDLSLTALQGLPLAKLHLDWCSWLSDAGLAAISGLPIATLTVTGARFVTPAGLANLRDIPLTDLSLRQCVQLERDGGLEALRGMALTRLQLEAVTRDLPGQTNAVLDPLEEIPTLINLGVKNYRSVDFCYCITVSVQHSNAFSRGKVF